MFKMLMAAILQPRSKEIASLRAMLITTFVLGSAIVAWSDAQCPEGNLSTKNTGGGACHCSNPTCSTYAQDGTCVQWACGDYFRPASESCANGSSDTFKTVGGCNGPVDSSSVCTSSYYTYTLYNYSTANCGLQNPSLQPTDTGVCSQSTIAQTSQAIDGFNNGGICGGG